jgi:hypothetical protein
MDQTGQARAASDGMGTADQQTYGGGHPPRHEDSFAKATQVRAPEESRCLSARGLVRSR